MAEHVGAELLSAYLDAELREEEARQVASHVADCPACQAHLAGLESVAAKLRSLERIAPPPTLVAAVEGRRAVPRRQDRLASRLQARMEIWRLEPSVGLAFALVVALALIVFGFFHHVQRWGQGGIPVLFVDWSDEEEGTEAEALEEAVVIELAGRSLVESSGGWRQVDVEGPPERILTQASDSWRELVKAHPELQELAGLDGAFLLSVAGEVLEVHP